MQINLLLPSAYSVSLPQIRAYIWQEEECGRQPQNDKMDLGRGLRPPSLPSRVHAAAHGFRSLRTVAVVRGSWRIRAATSPRRSMPRTARCSARSSCRTVPTCSTTTSFVRFDAAHPARRPRGAADRRGAHRHGGCRFRNHSGIDILAGSRGGEEPCCCRTPPQGGGSTIAQQLAKNLFRAHGPQPGPDRAQDNS